MIGMLHTVSRTTLQADTVVMTVARDGFDLLAALAHGLVALFFITLLLVLLVGFWQLRKARRALSELQRKVEAEPILMRARSTVENVEFIVKSVRGEVEKMNAAVSSLSDRLTQASQRMEERIEDFNALMEVLQSEAEDVFIDTAAGVRGVRAGARSLRSGDGGGGSSKLRPPPGGGEPTRNRQPDDLPPPGDAPPATGRQGGMESEGRNRTESPSRGRAGSEGQGRSGPAVGREAERGETDV